MFDHYIKNIVYSQFLQSKYYELVVCFVYNLSFTDYYINPL